MAGKVMAVALVALLVMAVAAADVKGRAHGLAFCNVTKKGLDACRPCTMIGSTAEPSGECCAALANADFRCLCQYKQNNPGVLKAMNIDGARAMQLPAKCGIGGAPATC